jgi:hypothetical protein
MLTNNRSKAVLVLVIVVIIVASIFSITPSSVHAQTASSGMKKTTSGGSLDVLVQPSPEPIGNKAQTSFKVTFLQKGTDNKVQPHIDYDFIIKDSNGKEIFMASQLAGQPGKPLHTAEGVVTIPYTFQSLGDYSINIPIYGILFNPIKPESAEYSIKVAPEFPIGVGALIMAAMIGIVLTANRFKKNNLDLHFPR